MIMHLASGEPGSTPALVRAACAMLILAYGATLVVPRFLTLRSAWREIARLEERRTVAMRHREDVPNVGADRLQERMPRLDPRDLLPVVSTIARRADLEIIGIKQSAVNKDGTARRIHLQAQAPFARVVDFVDRVAVAIPVALVEELALRRTAPRPGGEDIDIELALLVAPAAVSDAPLDSEGE
jgi:hypothetical protein